MNRLYILLLIVVVFVLSFLLYKKVVLDKEEIAQSNYTFPELRSIRKEIIISGTITPESEVRIKSSISGVLEELFINVGDSVQKRDKIARIRILSDPLEINRLEGEIKLSRVNYTLALSNYKRQKELFAGNVIPESSFNESLKAYQSAKLKLEVLLKERELFNESEIEKRSNYILATAQGIVLALPLEKGEYVAAANNFNDGSEIAILADLSKLKFKGFVSEKDVHYLHKNMKMNIEIHALGVRNNFESMIKIVSPQGNLVNNSVKFQVLADFSMNDSISGLIKPGYSARGNVLLEQKDSILCIEERFIYYKNDSSFLLVENRNGEFIPKHVKLGISNGIYIELMDDFSLNTKIKLFKD